MRNGSSAVMIQVDVLGRGEHVVGFALGPFVFAVLIDDRHLVDEFQLEVGVAQRLAQSGQIAVHRCLGHGRRLSIVAAAAELQSPGLESLNVGLVDLVQPEIGPGPIGEQFLVALVVELDRALLLDRKSVV